MGKGGRFLVLIFLGIATTLAILVLAQAVATPSPMPPAMPHP